jgi:hypothetical protein
MGGMYDHFNKTNKCTKSVQIFRLDDEHFSFSVFLVVQSHEQQFNVNTMAFLPSLTLTCPTLSFRVSTAQLYLYAVTWTPMYTYYPSWRKLKVDRILKKLKTSHIPIVFSFQHIYVKWNILSFFFLSFFLQEN